MLHGGRLPVLMLVLFLLAMGYNWWSFQPHFPIDRPSAELVLRQSDLGDSFLPDRKETGAILTNPYEDYTEHFRSGYRAVFDGATGSQWQETKLVSTTFVVDRKGAEKVFGGYLGQTQNRGETLKVPPLGDQSRFILARNEASAPVMVIGTVRVQNVLVTLTVMTDREIDPAVVYGWAKVLVDRAVPR